MLATFQIRQAGLTHGSPEKYFGDVRRLVYFLAIELIDAFIHFIPLQDFQQLTTTIQHILDALGSGSHYTTAYDIAHFERTLAAVRELCTK